MIHKGEEIKNFDSDEFLVGELQFVGIEIIQAVDKFRDLSGVPIYPSIAPGALARIDNNVTNQHHARSDGSVLSKAMDWFPGRGESITRLLMLALGSGLFGGIGVYFDTNGFVHSSKNMFHTDVRPKENGIPILWYRVGGSYFYPFSDKMRINTFMSLLRRADENL